MIYVLTYNVPHRKTQDLLYRLSAKGYNNIVVLATPWVVRNNYKPLIPHRPLIPIDITPEHFSKRFKYSFQKVEIDNIANVVGDRKKDIILIGGSGILPKDVVQLGNIINAHPSWLPYIRGLDALKWAIYFDKPIGVTSHIISDEVDAGLLIKRELVPLYPWDTFHSVAYRQYEMEIDILCNSITDIKNASLEPLPTDQEVRRRMPNSKEKKLMKRFERIMDKHDTSNRIMTIKDYKAHDSSFVDENVKIGRDTEIWHYSHIQSGAIIGTNCILGQNVNIGVNVKIGNYVKIQNNVSVYEGVELEDHVFCGPSMVFTNIKYPRSEFPQKGSEYYQRTLVKKSASIGANATVLCGITIGEYAVIGAGTVVTKNVPDYALIMGNPGKITGYVDKLGKRISQ